MSFTILFALFALLALVVIFGVSYKIKGLKVAFFTTGAAFVLFALLFVVVIYFIVNAMN